MLNKKFNDAIRNLEENISNKEDLEFAKKQVTDLAISYLDNLNNIESKYDAKIRNCTNRVEQLEEHLQKLEKELFEEDDVEFEPITCPYCNAHFMIECDSELTEMDCPDCNNTIELDWGDFEDDM
jgi:ssDNA-binding Zn-finger/Zn-ribbon topoisomerase 1